MCSSFLPFFFGFVITRFSSSLLIYHSFFLTVAHLLLAFLPLSLVLSSVGLNWNLDKASSKASSGRFKGIKVELRGRHAFLRLNI